MKDLTKIIVAGVSTVALAGGISAGLAYADTPTDEPTSPPTTTTTSSPTETPAAEPSGRRAPNGLRKPLVRRQLRFVARSLHGEVTLAGEKHRVIAFQRGGVQKISRTSLTVKSNDGFVETYALSDHTKVRENGDKAKLSDIDSTDRVLVVSPSDRTRQLTPARYIPATVSTIKITFSTETTPITNQATPIVARLVGTRCISLGSDAIRTNGTSANGIPNDKIT